MRKVKIARIKQIVDKTMQKIPFKSIKNNKNINYKMIMSPET